MGKRKERIRHSEIRIGKCDNCGKSIRRVKIAGQEGTLYCSLKCERKDRKQKKGDRYEGTIEHTEVLEHIELSSSKQNDGIEWE